MDRYYCCTSTPLTSALDGVDGQRHAPAALLPGKTRYHYTAGCVGPRAGMDGSGKSRPHTGIRFPDRATRSESLYRLINPGAHYDLYSVFLLSPSCAPQLSRYVPADARFLYKCTVFGQKVRQRHCSWSVMWSRRTSFVAIYVRTRVY